MDLASDSFLHTHSVIVNAFFTCKGEFTGSSNEQPMRSSSGPSSRPPRDTTEGALGQAAHAVVRTSPRMTMTSYLFISHTKQVKRFNFRELI